MGTEFVELFDRWAESYDQTVAGIDEEYKEVFVGYGKILQEVANRSSGHIIEFGVGTGNLSSFLLSKADHYTGIEPSEKMRLIASKKLDYEILSGDFLHFPLPEEEVQTIVSTYAFHHLTDDEKQQAANLYSKMLNSGHKVVFADTMFINEDEKQEIIQNAKEKRFLNLAEDLKTEYYTTIPFLTEIFEQANFEVSFQSMNKFVWILEATKR
ncbi:class I SAM-dependent methyltransferase [Bacillus shivajii]|uniref:class I SAM-dependent DNA methyltransferase n=1 Tax=Bacillus shivajii TaxID=1983719 RepID=UPI001CF98123|nr:class I SAM-dependent methyltransferase [Bacillus shivajii]UCZ51906.1 class I SAM-dependent methyltransferase [Bacillus shivajii]